jgi:hypothetical protein
LAIANSTMPQSNSSNNTNNTSNTPVDTKQGTGFVNLQSFLAANQGNQLGNTVSNDISNNVNQTNNDLNTSNQAFSQGVSQNAFDTSNNQNQATNIINEASNLGGGQTLDNNDQNQFSTWAQGGYAGPTTLNNSQQLQNEANQTQQIGQATSSQNGRLGLLQNFIGGNGYTQGEANLDNMLLSPSTGQLQQSAQGAQGAVNNVNQSLNSAQQQAQTVAQQNQLFGQNITGQANQAYTGYQTGLTNQATADNANESNLYNTDLSALQNPTANSLSTLPSSWGLQYGMQTNGVNPATNGYLQQEANATAQNVANSSDISRLNALAQLSGTTNTFVNQLSTTPYDPTQAVTFNNPAFSADVNQAANSFQKQIAITPTNSSFMAGVPDSTYAQVMQNLPQLQTAAQGDLALYNQIANEGGSDSSSAQNYAGQVNDYNNLISGLQAAESPGYLGGTDPNLSQYSPLQLGQLSSLVKNK